MTYANKISVIIAGMSKQAVSF